MSAAAKTLDDQAPTTEAMPNPVPAPAAPPPPPRPPQGPPPAERREVKLPSGRTAQILVRGQGRHIQAAGRMAGGMSDQLRLFMAVVAVKATVDSKALTLEDVLDMDDGDVWALIGECMGKGVTSPSGT